VGAQNQELAEPTRFTRPRAALDGAPSTMPRTLSRIKRELLGGQTLVKSVIWRLFSAVVRSPFIWGAVLSAGWYGFIVYGPVGIPELRALFAEHPLEYVSAGLFFVGIASLGLRSVDLIREGKIVRLVEFQLPGQGGLASGLCWASPEDLRKSLEQIPRTFRDTRLIGRFEEILRYLELNGSLKGLQEHVRYIADKAAADTGASYALVRMFIWAIPILGFLGTVVGIALALGNLAPQQLEESLPEVMAGLTVAFNTTIQALGLCIVLYFALFFVERAEAGVLERLDSVVEQVVASWTKQSEGQGDLGLERTSCPLVDAVSEAFRVPVAVWEQAVGQLAHSLREVGSSLAEQIHQEISQALDRTFAAHCERLSLLEHQILSEHRKKLEELQNRFQERVEVMVQLQQSVEEHTELLIKVVETAQVLRTLQESLNRNLATLAASQQFQELLMSLTAAIHLLTARVESSLGELGPREMSGLGIPAVRKAS
jgi:biopolymer transport protein ExbB/TolQ